MSSETMNEISQKHGGGEFNQTNYSAPVISLLEVSAEQGFATSQFEHGEYDPY